MVCGVVCGGVVRHYLVSSGTNVQYDTVLGIHVLYVLEMHSNSAFSTTMNHTWLRTIHGCYIRLEDNRDRDRIRTNPSVSPIHQSTSFISLTSKRTGQTYHGCMPTSLLLAYYYSVSRHLKLPQANYYE